jgi:integrase
MEVVMPSLFKRSNGVYYISYEQDGKRKWKSTGRTVKAEAYREMMRFDNNLRTYKSRVTLQEFTSEFLTHAEATYASSTRELYLRSLTIFQNLTGNKALSAISPKDADLYRTARSKQVSPVSVNMELRTLKAAFGVATRWRLITENPFRKVAFLRIPEHQPSYVRKEDFGRLLQSIKDQWFKDLITFAALTGLRRGEIINLRWRDVDFQRRLIYVQSTDTFTTKTGKRRTVPMNETVYQLLCSKSSSGGELVFTFDGSAIRPDLVTRKFRFAVRKAGLDRGLHFHSLRHTFATWLVQGSVGIYQVQKLLGHSNISVTEVYSHLATSELHQAVNSIELIDGR